MKKNSGFTLVELLVVIAIIAVLTSLTFVGYGKVKLSAHKAKSIANMRSLSTITMAMAQESNGNFPSLHLTNNQNPYWFSGQKRRIMEDQYGLTRDMCYTDSNECWKKDGYDICQNRELWDWQGGSSASVWGYSYLVNDARNGEGSDWGATGTFSPPEDFNQIKDSVTYVDENGEERIRWIPRNMYDQCVYPLLWADLTRVYNGEPVGNFMKSSGRLLGTNIARIDGSVEWIPEERLKERFSNGSLKLVW
ncbi:MAG: type II secretion system protein [Verrucomicrobiales bacterium]